MPGRDGAEKGQLCTRGTAGSQGPTSGARADKSDSHRREEAKELHCLPRGCWARPPAWMPRHGQQRWAAPSSWGVVGSPSRGRADQTWKAVSSGCHLLKSQLARFLSCGSEMWPVSGEGYLGANGGGPQASFSLTERACPPGSSLDSRPAGPGSLVTANSAHLTTLWRPQTLEGPAALAPYCFCFRGRRGLPQSWRAQ